MNGLMRPLEGIRVLTLENFVAGPYCSMWLADAGAEVVKIEAPEQGDLSRSTSPVRIDDQGRERGLGFVRHNRNKKSVALDLKHPEGKSAFIELSRRADIVIENLRPGVMTKLGLDYEALKQANPRLIYVAISGFGQQSLLPSPYLDRPAFDIVAQAMSGLMYRPDRSDDRPTYLGFSLSDLEAGIVAAYGAMLALVQRGRTGEGQLIDISLYDSSLILNEISVTMFSAFRQTPKPGLHAVTAPFGTYKAKDGYIVIAVLGEHIWARFCEAIGQPELKDDPRFGKGPSRFANLEALNAYIETWLLPKTRDEAVKTLLAGGVPASIVQEIDDVFECPHVAARGMLMTLDDPAWGPIQVVGNPVKMSGAPAPLADPPPGLGEHTETVLKQWLRMDDGHIAGMRDRKAI